MKKVVVLGAGLVGREVARDLTPTFDVTSVDNCRERVEGAVAGTSITPRVADLSDAATVTSVIEPAEIVVGALPGWMGKACLETVIRSGKDTVDIAFFPEDPFELDELAKKNGVTALVDFGVCPGSSSVLIGYQNARMERLERIECLVGGLPVVRKWPFEYTAPFSPSDVIEEYTRPARYVENGQLVTRPALSDPELIHFDGIGALEALNTDGLRTLATTIDCPNMREKTLRYPNHGRFMEALREVGFFDKEPIEVDGVEVSPLAVTSALIFPHWKLEEGEEEFTVLRVEIDGRLADGSRERITYDLLDRYDKASGVSSMARTTGYTCTAGVHLLAKGMFERKGICPPEYIGEDAACSDFVLAHLAARGVVFSKSVEAID
jgi:saccharopine dehydrogenase-like NADP-dependent oxidoreductase